MDSNLINKVVAKVFPAGAELTFNPREVEPEERFWVISGKREPRLIIPQNPKYGMTVLKQWAPYTTWKRNFWSLILAVYRKGLLGAVPGVRSIGVSGARRLDWAEKGWDGADAPCTVSIIGHPGRNRKVVTAFVDMPTTKTRMFVKAPLTPFAAEHILNEANILARLPQREPPLGPKLFFVNQKEAITGQEAMVGRQASKECTGAHLVFNKLLADEGETSLGELLEIKMAQWEPLSWGTDSDKEMLKRLFEKTNDQTSFPSVWVHGDFKPTNLIWVDKDTLVAVDWEMSWANGPPLYDIFHLQYHFFEIGETKYPDREIKSNPYYAQYAEFFNINDSLYEKLLLFYLVSQLMKSLELDAPQSRISFIKSVIRSCVERKA